MKKLLFALLLSVPLMAATGIEFGTGPGKQMFRTFGQTQAPDQDQDQNYTDEDDSLPIGAPADHALTGTYNEHGSYSTSVTIDKHGRITNDFYVTVNGAYGSWLARFPQRLKFHAATGTYFAQGVIYGSWSNGITCNYPMTMVLSPSEDHSILDATIRIPAQYASNCQSWGTTTYLWSLDKVK